MNSLTLVNLLAGWAEVRFGSFQIHNVEVKFFYWMIAFVIVNSFIFSKLSEYSFCSEDSGT